MVALLSCICINSKKTLKHKAGSGEPLINQTEVFEVVTFKRESERDRGGFTCHIITNIIQFYRNEGRDGAVAEGERAPGRALLVCRVEPRGHTSRVMRRGPRDKNMG